MSDLLLWQKEEMNKLRRDMDRMFDQMRSCFETSLYAGRAMEAPTIHVYETRDSVTVYVEAPGFKPDEIDLSLTEDTLSIRCEKRSGGSETQNHTQRVGAGIGSLTRTVRLPCKVKAEEAKATYKEDALHVLMPKWKLEKIRLIRIDSA